MGHIDSHGCFSRFDSCVDRFCGPSDRAVRFDGTFQLTPVLSFVINACHGRVQHKRMYLLRKCVRPTELNIQATQLSPFAMTEKYAPLEGGTGSECSIIFSLPSQ